MSGTRVLIPYPVTVAAGVALIVLLRRQCSWKAVFWLAVIALLALSYVLVHLIRAPEQFRENAMGSAHLIYTLIAGMGFYYGLLYLGKDASRRLFLRIWILVAVLCVLEVYAGLGAISDVVRRSLHPVIYEADLRDIRLYGHVRPKVFSKEPSLVALFFSISFLAWLMLSKQGEMRRIVLAFGATVFALWVIRSPVVVIIFSIALIDGLYSVHGKSAQIQRLLQHLTITAGFAVIVAALAVTYFVAIYTPELFPLRSSLLIRVVAPLAILIETIKTTPILGFGIGVEEGIRDLIVRLITELPVLHFVDIQFLARDGKYLFTNSAVAYWISTGVVGGVVLLAAFGRFFKALGVSQRSYLLLIATVLLLTIGGFVSLRNWFPIFLFAAVLTMLDGRYRTTHST